MSAANRGSERRPQDFYPTPDYTTRSFLRKFDISGYNTILEPCSGDGAIVKVLNEFTGPNTRVITNEIRSNCNSDYNGDFSIDQNMLDTLKQEQPDLIITNPPYNLAQEFVSNSLEILKPMGVVVMLLRVNFMGAQKRHAWWQTINLKGLYVLSERPKFLGKGKGTDATEYAWFVFSNEPCIGSQTIRII